MLHMQDTVTDTCLFVVVWGGFLFVCHCFCLRRGGGEERERKVFPLILFTYLFILYFIDLLLEPISPCNILPNLFLEIALSYKPS